MSRDLLNKTECDTLKGVCILIIMWHNLVLMINDVVKVNEHSYNSQYVLDMINSYLHPSSMTILNMLSHYVLIGVLGITFISGYGLVLKYEHGKNTVSSPRFLASHYEKLIVLMAIGLIIYYLLIYVAFQSRSLDLVDLTTMLSLTANCINISAIKPRPFWYFGMIMQLYIIYRIFLYPFSANGSKGRWFAPLVMMMISLLPMIVFSGHNGVLYILRYNFPIGCMPFCMGVLAARFGHDSVNHSCFKALIVLIIAFVFATIMELNVHSWLLLATPAYVLIAILIVKSLPRRIATWIAKIGTLSSALYIIHPTIRLFFKNTVGEKPYISLLVYTIVCIMLAIPFQKLLKSIPRVIKV